MPFPYQASATPVRTRKPLREREKDREKDRDKDKDARSTTSGSSRRHREGSRSSNRSPLPPSSRPASLYNQANLTLDQLPPLPRSETASPSSQRSPTLRPNTGPPSSLAPISSSIHPYTPAALQPYLETDDDEEFDNAKTPQASSTVQPGPYFESELTKTPSAPEPTPKRSPISPTAPADTATKTPSPQQAPTSPLALSRVNTRLSDPTPNLQHPRPFHFPTSSPAFTHPLPFFGGPPSEPYLPHLPPGPQYFPMAPNSTHSLDSQPLPPQNYYQPYGSPPQMPASFNAMRSPPAREYSSTNSRLSFSGELPPAIGPMQTMSAEPAPLPQEGATTGASKAEEDAVLQRIQSAIPDLHLLLNRYRETSGQLGERELTLRHTEAEKMKVLEQRDSYIDRLTKERDEALHKHREDNNRHAEEKSRMRLEIGNMSEQRHELQENLQAEKKARESTEKVLQDTQAQYALLVSQTSAEKAAMSRHHDDLNARTKNELEAMEMDLRTKEHEFAERLQQQARESEAILQSRTTDLDQKHRKERETLESAWSTHRRELEDRHTKLRRDLADAKNNHIKALDEHTKKHNQEKEGWLRERQSLIKDFEGERAKMGQGSADLHSQHQREKDDLYKTWKSSQTRLEQEHAESKAKMNAEIERLKTGWEADRSRFNGVIAELKATASKLNTENTKLQKLADAFEQVTDLRGRDDAYYHEAFDVLWQQISALAEGFCSVCPAQLSNEVQRRIPPNIPFFLVDTPACARLRIAYVQSLVSNIITDRIFQHFLFTHDHLDDTFNEWAEYLRHKSTKREAFWRQRTLHAAFSSHSSKAKINKFAGEIIEEIVSAIKPFGDTSKRQQMVTAVKQIVKTAAETWRYARIELARITAWPTTQLNEEEDGEHLLSVFPRIEREALPNDFRRDAEEDKGCVYSTGQTLSKKSSAVLARRVELGEIPPMPVVADDARREHRRPRKMSSEIASRARMFEPRSSSPLIAPPGDKESSRGKAATVSDEISDMNSAEQYQADSRHGSSDGRSMGSQEEAKETVDEGCWGAGAEHAAAPSPLQSPVHSRGGTPQLRAQSTGVSDSLVEDEEASEGMKKSATIPNWGGAGGDIPGAYGW